MKKIFIVTLLTFLTQYGYAQVKSNQQVNNASINGQTPFLDASSSSVWNGSTNNGKGLVFPRTDLTLLTSFVATPNGIGSSYPTRLDGMIVYNTAASGVAGVGSTQGILSPGYWYYDNKSSTLNGGTWKPFTAAAASTKVNITDNTATITNLQFNGKDVMMQKGTFTTNGTTTAPTAYSSKVTIPATGSVYRVTIFKAGTGTVYSNGVYSYDNTTGNIITGSPSISVVYPAGTYDYTVEYIN